MPIIINCEYCGKSFETINRKRGRQKYCSKACYDKSQKKPLELKVLHDHACLQCGKKFRTRKKIQYFCSRGCSASWYHNPKQRGQGQTRVVKCLACGKEFKRHSINHKYCSHECFTSQNTGENNNKFNNYITSDERYLRYTEQHPQYPGRYVHQVVWELNGGGSTCEICGADLEHIHHKDENRFNNDFSNLMGLCNTCHLSIHAKRNKFWKHRKNLNAS